MQNTICLHHIVFYSESQDVKLSNSNYFLAVIYYIPSPIYQPCPLITSVSAVYSVLSIGNLTFKEQVT